MFRNYFRFFTLFFTFISVILLISVPLFIAQADPPPSAGRWSVPNPLLANTFEELIYYIAVWLIMVGIPLSVLAFLWAGFLFITSAGNEEKIKKARRTLTWAVIGLAIILIGTGLSQVVKDLLGVRQSS